MCFPPAIIAAALIAGGTGLKYAGDKQAESAQLSTFANERNRQQQFTADQTAKFQDSLDRTKSLFDPNAEKAAVDSRESGLVAAIAPPQTGGSYLPGSSSAPSVVSTAQDKATAGSAATSSSLAHLMAVLGGAADQKQAVDTQIGRNSGDIGQISGFSAGSAAVAKYEMKAAAQKGAFLQGLGGFAQTVGRRSIPAAGAGAGVPIMQDAPSNFSGIY